MQFKLLIQCIAWMCLVACRQSASDIGVQMQRYAADDSWQTIDLTQESPGKWDRLCVLGPYGTQESQNEVLGFRTDLITSPDESKMWLVFVSGSAVWTVVPQQRDKGDLVKEANRCFPREDAKFSKNVSADRRWIYLRQLKDA